MNFGYFTLMLVSIFTIGCQGSDCKSLKASNVEFRLLKSKSDTIKLLNRATQIVDNFQCRRALEIAGVLQIQLGEFRVGTNYLRSLYEIDSKNTVACYYLANSYRQMDNYDSAFYFINAAMSTMSRNGVVTQNIPVFVDGSGITYEEIIFFQGMLLFEQKHYQEAKKRFQVLQDKSFELQNGSYYLSAIYFEEGNSDSACYFYRHAMGIKLIPEFDSLMMKRCFKFLGE